MSVHDVFFISSWVFTKGLENVISLRVLTAILFV
jgi:hypothetical protein